MQDIIEFTNQNIWLVSGLVASGLAVIFYELRLKARDVGSLSTAMAVKAINGGTAVVDVRPAEQFATGHIVDARNIPAEDLKSSDDKLAKNKQGEAHVRLRCPPEPSFRGITPPKTSGPPKLPGGNSGTKVPGGCTGWCSGLSKPKGRHTTAQHKGISISPCVPQTLLTLVGVLTWYTFEIISGCNQSAVFA